MKQKKGFKIVKHYLHLKANIIKIKKKSKIIPNQNGYLSEDISIPYEVKKVIKVLNNDLKSQFKLNSVGKMNEYLNKADKNTKKEASSMIIDISPSDPSIIPQQTNIQNLYHNLTKTIPKVSVIDCKNKGFWIDANNIIIKYFETLIYKSGIFDHSIFSFKKIYNIQILLAHSIFIQFFKF